jgi:hypothetical protein
MLRNIFAALFLGGTVAISTPLAGVAGVVASHATLYGGLQPGVVVDLPAPVHCAGVELQDNGHALAFYVNVEDC